MYTVEDVPTDWSDEVVADINAFENAWRLEVDPATPPMPASTTRAHRDLRENPMQVFAARDAGGQVVGTAWIDAASHNRHLLFALIAVSPAHRHRGVAAQLLERVVAFAEADGRPQLLLASDYVDAAAEAFAASLGAVAGVWSHINQLVVADVDLDQMQAWVDDSDDDYDIEWVTPDGPYPESALTDMARLRSVLLNDAPMGDVPLETRTISVDEIRKDEERLAGYGKTRWTAIARHRASGDPVGYTELFVDPGNRATLNQGATAVDRAHRGHRLGRQLKAHAFLRVLRERPETKFIRTFNADANAPMLAVNEAMGFTPLFAACRWLLDTVDAKTWLERRR